MFLFPIGFFYACFMVAGKRIAAKQRKENAVFLGMESGWPQTPASISSSRLQDRNVTGTVYKCALFHRGLRTLLCS